MTETIYEALDAEKAFYAFIATVDAQIRDAVETSAWGNVFSADVTDRDRTHEAAAWREALATAEMIADAPADFQITD